MGGDDVDSPPPPKKSKIEREEDPGTETSSKVVVPRDSILYKGKIIRPGSSNDPEYVKQRKLFQKQWGESEGYEVDWDSFDYKFGVVNFHWNTYTGEKLSDDELLKLLIQTASVEHDQDYGTRLEFVKYDGANMVAVKGLLYYISFWAKDLNSSDQHPKPYQAKVWRFCDDNTVLQVRPKPTPHKPH